MKSKYCNLDSVLVNSSFNQSLKEHQLFVDVLLANSRSDGIINLSQTQMAKLLGKSQTLVSCYIKQLNRIDQCVSQVARGVYRLNYSDIVNNGVFPIIRKSLTKIMISPSEYICLSHKEKADYLNVDIKLIPVIEAYFYMDVV